MHLRGIVALAAACCALVLCPIANAADEQLVEPYWVRARTSWYGNQEGDFVGKFAPYRGGGRDAFGVIPWGGCGYTNGDGTVVWPREAVTSYADQNPDFPGSCGRCYEVKCVDGDVVGWNNQPVNYKNNYFAFWEYQRSVPDDQGRAFPGNLGERNQTPTVNVQCWQPKQTVVVKVIDICPCLYAPKGRAPYHQHDCCYKSVNHPKAGQINLDMSYWAFQKLAHPEYGIMMVDIRPVDCDTRQPIRMQPGYISTLLYSDMPGVGWAWFATGHINNNFQVVAKGEGRGSSAAACAQMRPKEGGMTWMCRKCGAADGYKPFGDTRAIEFWIRDKVTPGQVPNVRLQVGNPDLGKWCNTELWLRGVQPVATEGAWRKFFIDVGALNCPDIGSASQIAFNPDEQATFCVDDLRLVKAGAPPATPTAAAPAAAPESPPPSAQLG